MSKPSLYQITGGEVDPVSDLLKAVVEVNWHLHRAERQGWAVGLSVSGDGRVTAVIERCNMWPNDENQVETPA